jgi:hypothetical protein
VFCAPKRVLARMRAYVLIESLFPFYGFLRGLGS